MEIAAELKGVTHRYGEGIALRDLTLTLRQGEVVALLGPNGAGKTTAVKLLLGLLRVQKGTARIFNASPRMTSTRMRIGAMLQVARTPETVKVKEYLQLFRSYYPNPMPLEQIVRRARLEGMEDRLLGSLSGGQRQRALFALAIAGNPDLVFLDEPTLGMDIEARRALWDEVRRLRSEGKTVLLTTHYLEEADALSDRIVVIRNGSIVAEGTPAEIKSGIVGKRICCTTRLSREQILQVPAVLDVSMADGVTTLRASDVEHVLRFLLREDDSIRNIEVTSPALEEAFLALTSEPVQEEVIA